MLVFFVWIIGLLGTLLLSVGGLMYVITTLADRRPCPVRVPAGMLCGYIAGALFVWTLVPHGWPLAFGTTLAATINAEKYGHQMSSHQITDAARTPANMYTTQDTSCPLSLEQLQTQR
jgi:hypothetical protein